MELCTQSPKANITQTRAFGLRGSGQPLDVAFSWEFLSILKQKIVSKCKPPASCSVPLSL